MCRGRIFVIEYGHEVMNMNETKKPKYGIGQNVAWMLGIAWETRKRTIFFCLLTAALEIGYNLAQLYIAPQILTKVEQQAPLRELIATIGFFTAALFLTTGLKDYVNQNVLFPRIEVRTVIIGKISRKCNTTSFPNTLAADFIKLREKAHMATDGNREATEHIWATLTSLLQNVGGFLVYLMILSHLDWPLLLAVIATCLVGFLVSRYTNNWVFAHREAEDKYYAQKRRRGPGAGGCGPDHRQGHPDLRPAGLAGRADRQRA